MPNSADIEEYVPKVDTGKAKKMLTEFFSTADVDLKLWLIMTKAKAKPPVDPGAAGKVALPQTILYNESSSTNAMFSAMLSRFHDVVDSLYVPGVKQNLRGSPDKMELWFNSHEPVRRSLSEVHRYEGDSYNYDSSLELMAAAVMLADYKAHGFDEGLLKKYEEIYGEKKAVSIMHGFVMWVTLQGVSGVFDTLWRNGRVTLAAVVRSASLTRDQIVTLAVTGDDFLLETRTRVDEGETVEGLALTYNFSAKFFGVEHMYFCSRYFVQVEGWWYWVADPLKKYESAVAAITRDVRVGERIKERHTALRDDLRHYDDYRVLEAVSHAVASRFGKEVLPLAIVQTLAAWADDFDRYAGQWLYEEKVGLV
jgi:hypothetical protein